MCILYTRKRESLIVKSYIIRHGLQGKVKNRQGSAPLHQDGAWAIFGWTEATLSNLVSFLLQRPNSSSQCWFGYLGYGVVINWCSWRIGSRSKIVRLLRWGCPGHFRSTGSQAPFICWRHAGSSKLRSSECRHGSLQITRLCHRHLQLVCFQTSTIECQEDGSSLVWNGGWTPQGGSSRQMSHYRFLHHSTSRCGSRLGCLLLMLICRWRRMWLELPGPVFTIFVVCARYDAILDETWLRDWYPPLSFQGWIIVTLCWLTCRPQR